MYRNWIAALSCLFLLTTPTYAASSRQLNELVNLLRQHTGIETGPVRYTLIRPDEPPIKIGFGEEDGQAYVSIEIVEEIGYVTKTNDGQTHNATSYVATYYDVGPDGILDAVARRFARMQDFQARRYIQTAPAKNQRFYDWLIGNILKDLRRTAPI